MKLTLTHARYLLGELPPTDDWLDRLLADVDDAPVQDVTRYFDEPFAEDEDDG